MIVLKLDDESIRGLSVESLGFLVYLKAKQSVLGKEIRLRDDDIAKELNLTKNYKRRVVKELTERKLITYRLGGVPTRQIFKVLI